MMTGEWWIQGGTAVFADGDTIDMNHEGFVYEHLLAEVASIIEFEFEDRYGPCDVVAFVESYGHYQDRVARESFGGDTDATYDAHRARVLASLGDERGAEAWDCIFSSHKADARTYAIKYLGWIRVAGPYVQVWTMAPQTLKELGDGLCDINDEERLEGTLHINVEATRTIFEEVPMHVVLKGSTTDLLPYRRRY